MAYMVNLLLEGPPEDPVLDWCGYLARNVRKSSFLCRISEYPLQRRIWYVGITFKYVFERNRLLITCCHEPKTCSSYVISDSSKW